MLGAATGTMLGNMLSYLTTTQSTYVGLHTGTPSMFNPWSNEIGTRQRVYWSVSGSVASNTSTITFTGLSTSNISYITINDALIGGNVLVMIPLNAPYALVATGSTGIYSIAAGSLFLNFENNPSVYVVDGGAPSTVFTTPTVAIGDGGTP
jgi:hypothetical protein